FPPSPLPFTSYALASSGYAVPLITISVSSKINSELPDILPADEASARRPYNVVPRGATTVSPACKLVSRVAVKRYPFVCFVVSIESTIRIRIRVPAGTVILFLLCAAALAEAGFAKPERGPSPKIPGIIATLNRNVVVQTNALRISVSPFPDATSPAQRRAARNRSVGQ